MELSEVYDWLEHLEISNAPANVTQWAQDSIDIIELLENVSESGIFNAAQKSVINNIGNDAKNLYTSYKKSEKEKAQQQKQEWQQTRNDYWYEFQDFQKQNNTGYFAGCTTEEELKAKYRKLAKEMHPDKGGDEEEFAKMNNEYQELIKQ